MSPASALAVVQGEIDEEMEDISSKFETDAQEFAKAGLFAEGMYQWEVESVAPGETHFDGVKATVIVGRLKAIAQAKYVDGILSEIEEFEVPKYKTQNFKTEGDGRQQLLTLYQVVTGRTPTGVFNEKLGRYVVNQLSLAEETVGGTAWNSIYHFTPKGKSETYAVLSKKFRKQPLPKFGNRGAKPESEESDE